MLIRLPFLPLLPLPCSYLFSVKEHLSFSHQAECEETLGQTNKINEIQIHTRGHQRSTRDGSLNEFFLAFSSMDTFSEDLVFLNEWLIAAVSRLYLLLFLLLLLDPSPGDAPDAAFVSLRLLLCFLCLAGSP